MATAIPVNAAMFSLAEVLEATGGATAAEQERSTQYCGVSTDTRALTPGGIFVALRGERFDGHDFVEAAVRAGATLAIVDSPVPCSVTQVVVDDTLRALGSLTALHRRRWGGTLVAIAGAAGKTTTRSVTSALLTELLGEAVHSTVGNLNNQVGVPMVVLGLTKQHRIAIIEVGTNQLGEVPLLAAVVQPDVAVLTLVDLEHSEGLGDLDSIEAEEGAVFASSCRVLVVNGDDARALRQAQQAQARAQQPMQSTGAGQTRPVTLLSYGFDETVQLRAVERTTVSPHETRLRLRRTDTGQRFPLAREFQLMLPMVGRPAAYALMAALSVLEALAVVDALGLANAFPATDKQAPASAALQAISRALQRPQLQPHGRAEVVELSDGSLIINDSYNANPPSVRAALETAQELAELRGGRLHLVLGEMRELGALSASAHAELGLNLNQLPWQTLSVIGAEMAPLVAALAPVTDPDRRIFYTASTLGVADELRLRLGPRDVVLVKGSRGVRTEQVVAELQTPKAV